MTRYIPDLATYHLDELIELRKEMLKDLDLNAAQGNMDYAHYTPNQVSFVELLIERKGGIIE